MLTHFVQQSLAIGTQISLVRSQRGCKYLLIWLYNPAWKNFICHYHFPYARIFLPCVSHL